MDNGGTSRKAAFLFPGQGSQFPGMGKTIRDSHAAARRVFEEADDLLKFSISRLCFEGPAEELKRTEITQPALLTVSVAALCVLREHGFRPDCVAGHSLGEYSALVAAGSLRFADAVRLVQKRGRYMQEAVPPGIGAMAALLKLPDGLLDSILSQAAEGEIVTAANFNSPEQVVIAGHSGAVGRAVNLAKAAGAKRVILLPVSAPFHCPLMKPAQEAMRAELDAAPFADLEIPLINNWAAAEIRTGAEARHGLIQQIPGAVLWTQSIRVLEKAGVGRCVEVGAGGVLTGLLKSIAPGMHGLKFGEEADLSKFREWFAN